MASKTEMFQLLRLLDQGAYRAEVIYQAGTCWEALDDETRSTMVAASGADGRRARIWAAGWGEAMERAVNWLDALAAIYRMGR